MARQSQRRFRFIQEIAEGGFGKVYLAEMMTGGDFSSIVAIKLLHGRWSDHEEIVMRARDEARLLGRLRHRNIVRVEDLSTINGQCAVVMEYLEGVDLKTMLTYLNERDEPFPLRSAFEVTAQIATALEAAYNHVPLQGTEPLRLIHRDIKPSNAMITAGGDVKLLDFGTARANFETREAHTQALAFGSQAYMAPERLLGDPDTPAADVFSLGITIYELLTGETYGKIHIRPERYENALDERLSSLDLTGLPPVLQDEGIAALRLMLAYEPEDRPSSGQVVDLMEALSDQADDMGLRRFCRSYVPPARAQFAHAPSDGDPLIGQTLFEDADGIAPAAASGVFNAPQQPEPAPTRSEPAHPPYDPEPEALAEAPAEPVAPPEPPPPAEPLSEGGGFLSFGSSGDAPAPPPHDPITEPPAYEAIAEPPSPVSDPAHAHSEPAVPPWTPPPLDAGSAGFDGPDETMYGGPEFFEELDAPAEPPDSTPAHPADSTPAHPPEPPPIDPAGLSTSGDAPTESEAPAPSSYDNPLPVFDLSEPDQPQTISDPAPEALAESDPPASFEHEALAEPLVPPVSVPPPHQPPPERPPLDISGPTVSPQTTPPVSPPPQQDPAPSGGKGKIIGVVLILLILVGGGAAILGGGEGDPEPAQPDPPAQTQDQTKAKTDPPPQDPVTPTGAGTAEADPEGQETDPGGQEADPEGQEADPEEQETEPETQATTTQTQAPPPPRVNPDKGSLTLTLKPVGGGKVQLTDGGSYWKEWDGSGLSWRLDEVPAGRIRARVIPKDGSAGSWKSLTVNKDQTCTYRFDVSGAQQWEDRGCK